MDDLEDAPMGMPSLPPPLPLPLPMPPPLLPSLPPTLPVPFPQLHTRAQLRCRSWKQQRPTWRGERQWRCVLC